MKKICMIMDGNFNFYKGKIYSPHMSYEKFSYRFSNHFSHVRIAARSFKKSKPIGDIVTGNNVEFISLGSSKGMKGFLKNFFKRMKKFKEISSENNILIIRMPGNISSQAVFYFLIKKINFHIEIVADPNQYFSKETCKKKLRFAYKLAHNLSMKISIKKALSVRYVTEEYLQKKFPAPNSKPIFSFSDVFLRQDYHDSYTFINRESYSPSQKIRILSVAMMQDYSKGHIDMIYIINDLKKEGYNVEISFIGDGLLKKEFEFFSEKIKTTNLTHFKGLLSSEEIHKEMGGHDLFLSASYQEGMPRAVIEALSFGMPVVSSNVGGLPEIINSKYLYPCGDHNTAKKIIINIFKNKELKKINKENIRRSKNFLPDIIDKKYIDYCNFINEKVQN